MPPLLAIIPAIAGIAGVGESIASAVSGPGTPPAPPLPTPPNQQQLAGQKAAIAQAEPNVIGATSGLANPDYNALISQILAGIVGQPGANQSSGFTPASSNPTNAVIANQSPNLSEYVNNFTS